MSKDEKSRFDKNPFKDEDSAKFVGLLTNNLCCRMVTKVGPIPFLGKNRGSSDLQGYD